MPEDFSPDELRRRRLLDLAMGQVRPTEPAPITPEEQNYLNVANRMPMESDYKPSLLRKILGAASGFGVGMTQGAPAGVSQAQTILRQPHTDAMRSWGQELDRAEAPMTLARSRRQEALKRDELGVHRATAASNLLRATDPTEWKPTTKEEALEIEDAKHPRMERAPTSEELLQNFYHRDPEGFKRYMELKSPNRSLSLAEQKELRAYENQLTTDRQQSNIRLSASLRPTTPETPTTSIMRQRQALENVLQNTATPPEIANRFKRYVTEVDTPRGKYWRLKTPQEISGVFSAWTEDDKRFYRLLQNRVALEMDRLRGIGGTTEFGSETPLYDEEEDQ